MARFNSLFNCLGNFIHKSLNQLHESQEKLEDSGPFSQYSLFFSLFAGNLTLETGSLKTGHTTSQSPVFHTSRALKKEREISVGWKVRPC
jgi:hypothetical protein